MLFWFYGWGWVECLLWVLLGFCLVLFVCLVLKESLSEEDFLEFNLMNLYM